MTQSSKPLSAVIQREAGQCLVCIPCDVLHEWRGKVLHNKCSFVELFLKEMCLPFIKVKDCVHESLERRLSLTANLNAKKLKAAKKSPTTFFQGRHYTCVLSEEDVVDINATLNALEKAENTIKNLKKK